MRLVAFALLFIAALPGLARAGTQSYASPGTYYFTVPAYSSLTVQVWGGGGGGDQHLADDATDGTYSSFNAVRANGGTKSYRAGTTQGAPGTGGTASGGDINLTGANGTAGVYKSYAGNGGNSPNGGTGGLGGHCVGVTYLNAVPISIVWTGYPYDAQPGVTPGGGGGGGCGSGGAGGGGYASRTYSPGQLPSQVTVVVGSGGRGASPYYIYAIGNEYAGGAGAPGAVSITWTDAPPSTCTLTTDWDPINKDIGTILRWSSTNATTMSISSIGSVSPAGGNTAIYPQTTTVYTGTVSGAGGSGSCTKTVTVAPPATASISISPTTINQGNTTTLTWSTTNADQGVYISNVGWVSSSGSAQVGAGGTYTITAYGFGGDATASDSLTLLASCTQDGVTLQSGESADFYSYSTAPTGQLCSSLTQTRTCTDGVLSGSDTYQYGSCACAVSSAYTCSDNRTIVRTTTNADCSSTVTTPYATCTAPTFCSAGSAVCIDPTPIYHPSQDGNGHLQVRPQLVAKGNTTKLFWNVENVTSCTVTGNDQSWDATAASAGGEVTDPIYQRTAFILSCGKIDGSTLTETQFVGTLPGFNEI